MTDPSSTKVLIASADGAEKRRGSRLNIEMAVTVTGMDPLGEPFREETITSAISCYGCKYRTRRYAAKDSMLILEIPRPDMPLSPRLVHARVIWVQRPRHHRETFQIGLELEVPGNVWGIDAPPADWFPHPDDLRAPKVVLPIAAVAAEPRVSAKGISVVEAAQVKTPEVVLQKAALDPEWETLDLPEPEPIVSRAAPAKTTDVAALRGLIGDTVKATTEAMIEEEIALLRKHFTGRLETALVETLKTFSELTTEIVKETRDACRASAQEVEGELQKLSHQAQRSVTETQAAAAQVRSAGEPLAENATDARHDGEQAVPARTASAGKKASTRRRKKTPDAAK